LAVLITPGEAHATPDVITILVSDAVDTSVISETLSGVEDQLFDAEDYFQHQVFLSQEPYSFELIQAIRSSKLLIIIGNRAVKAYSAFQEKEPADAHFPIALIVSAINVDFLLNGVIRNGIGIRYEIPLITIMTVLRSLSGEDVDRGGVIYDHAMQDHITSNEANLENEGYSLTKYAVDGRSRRLERDIKRGLRSLLRQQIDGLWVLNDANLLRSDLLLNAWIPALRREPLPVVVSNDLLVQKQFEFANIGIYPDHYEMGAQAIEIVFRLQANQWQSEIGKVYQPLSVRKVFNQAVSNKKNIKYNPRMLYLFDQVIE
jgi:hypothetical protein